MNKSIWTPAVALGVLCLALGGSAIAADDTPPPPQPPFVHQPAEWASWVATVTPSKSDETKDPAKGPQRLVKMQVSQTGKVKQEINTWSDGQTSEVWTISGNMLVEDSKTHALTLIDPVHSQAAAYSMRYDLSLLSWVSLKTYVSVETHAGHKCYMYRNGPPTSAPDKPINGRYINTDASFLTGFASPSAQAWVDVQTHELVSIDDGTAVYDFTFGAAPTAELVPPPKFENLWQGYQDAMNPLKNQPAPIH